MFSSDGSPMKNRRLLILIAVIILLMFGCAEADGDGWLRVQSNQYVLISRSLDESVDVSYAAVKITQQGNSEEDPLAYEWVVLNPGERQVLTDLHNFEAGRKEIVGRFGIGFKEFRFGWQASSETHVGRIKPIWHGVEGVRYCVSQYAEVWGRNLSAEMEELDAQGKCR